MNNLFNKDIFNKWKDGLARTRKTTFGRIASMFGATEVTPQTWDELEALLVQADLGLETTEMVLESLKERVNKDGITQANELREVLKQILRSHLDAPAPLDFTSQPTVVLIVGVNGSGKTTSIAKLGKHYSQQG